MSTSTLHPLSKFLPKRPMGPMRAPARVLGWFSIGLGLAGLAMPRAVARFAGMPTSAALIRAYGVREIGVGVGMLTSKDPSPWLWGRVACDALDIGTVATGLAYGRSSPLRAVSSLAVLAGIAWVDAQCALAAAPQRKAAKSVGHDYSGRSGFPQGVQVARGIAAKVAA